MNELNTNALRQLADDIDKYGELATIERWEWRPRFPDEWTDCAALPSTYRILEGWARRKPQTITVNGVEVPEPLREVSDEQVVWTASPVSASPWRITYKGFRSQYFLLRLGLLHATKEAAQKHMDAMTLPSRMDES